ncbi:TetR/AcrR family transcriptional regulator [Zavarzinia sp.]|uniref:TetR/AcrR family transcriptional regulator n=1 Tax=Zavarzinia sp. TaxID=2027920 RepID=UPI0035659A31
MATRIGLQAEFSTEALCRSILERHHATIAVQKPDFALRKLEVIVAAALKLSNRSGFQAMSLRELARTSGVSMGGLYAYFDSKTTLLKMILGAVVAAVEQALSQPPETVAADPVAHLGWLIETHVRLSEVMLPWFAFSFMEAKNFPPAERRMAIDSEELTEGFLARAIEQGIASGRFRPDTSPLLPTLIKPMLQDWYVKRSKYQRRKVTIEQYVTAVREVALAACLP